MCGIHLHFHFEEKVLLSAKAANFFLQIFFWCQWRNHLSLLNHTQRLPPPVAMTNTMWETEAKDDLSKTNISYPKIIATTKNNTMRCYIKPPLKLSLWDEYVNCNQSSVISLVLLFNDWLLFTSPSPLTMTNHR